MKRFQLPKNKLLRLLINIFLIVIWFFIFAFPLNALLSILAWNEFMGWLVFRGIRIHMIMICVLPMFFITRYVWFEKSRDRIFYGLFDKFKTIRKFEPRIYTTSSNADELKKYADLRDQGIITEEEFQSKKKKLLDL